MKYFLLFIPILMIAGVSIASKIKRSVEPSIFQNEIRKNQKLIGQYVGYSFGKTLVKDRELSLDINDVIEGLKKVRDGKQIEIGKDQYRQLLIDLEEKEIKQAAIDNLAKANLFLSKIRLSEDVAEVKKGKLYFKVMAKGNGPKIDQTGTGSFHIKCSTINGDEVINTYARDEPVVQNLQEAIVGFTKGVSGMKEGEKRILYIHPDLAYGCFNIFEPSLLFIAEVELLQVLN